MVAPPVIAVPVPTGAADTTIDSAAVSAGAAILSVQLTVKLDVPAVVGVPLMVATLMVNPLGKLPTGMEQLYGGFPPVMASVCEYPLPTVPSGRLVVVISIAAATVPAVIDPAGTPGQNMVLSVPSVMVSQPVTTTPFLYMA
jgi:hypothetical protein